MTIASLTGRDLVKAVAVGIGTALILSAVMVPAFLAGLPPMPEPPSLAFAKALLGAAVPMPIGLLFHVAYVTAWSVVFVVLFRDRPSFLRALGLAAVLWVVALAVFFPVNGWGFLGLGVSPKLIPAAAVPHLMFAVVLWGLCRWAFGATGDRTAATEQQAEQAGS